MAEGTPLRRFFYEIALVADGVEPGSAQAQAAFKSIEDAATRAGLKVEAVTAQIEATTATAGAAASTQSETFGAVAASADAAATKVDGLRAAQERWLAEARAGRGASGKAFETDITAIPDPFAGMEKAASESGKKVADALLSGVREQYASQRVELQQQLAAGLIDPTAFKQQLKSLLVARNEAILGVVDQAAKAGKLDGPNGGEVLVALTSQLKDVDQAATGAARGGIQRLERSAVQMASSMVGAKSGVGGFLGQLTAVGGGGGGVMVAAAIAIGVLAAAWDALTEKTRAYAEKAKQTVDRLLQQADAEKSLAAKIRDTNAAIDERAKAGPGFKSFFRASVQSFLGGAGAGATSLGLDVAQQASDIEVAGQQAAKNATKEANKERDNEARSLASILAAHKETATEQQRINVLTASYRAELKTLRPDLTSTSDEIRRAAFARKAEILSILDAFTKPAEKANKEAEKLANAQRTALQGFDTAIASQTTDAADNLETQIAKLVADAEKAKVAAAVIAEKVNELRAAAHARLKVESDHLAGELQRELVATTGSQSLALKQGLTQFLDDVQTKRGKGLTVDPATVAAITAAKEQAIEWAKAAERLTLLYADIDQDLQTGGNLIRDMANVNTELASAEADRDAARARINAGDATAWAAYQNAQQRINQLHGEQNKLQARNQKLLDDAAARSTTIAQRIGDTASGIANAANAAFGLASALFGADSAAAQLFGSIGQVAGGISSVSGLADKAGGFGALLSTGSGIASAMPGLGQIVGGALAVGATLFGKDPEEQRRQEITRQNTAAIVRLTQRVGDLAKINAPGNDVILFRRLLTDPTIVQLMQDPFKSDQLSRTLGANLAANGKTFQDLFDFGKQFGIGFDTSRIRPGNISQLVSAIDASELTQFGDTFAGQMQRFDTAVQLFPDLSVPSAQLDAYRQSLDRVKGGGGVLSAALRTFDVSTAEGVERARNVVRGFFDQMNAGTLTPEMLGGLTGQEFLDALLKADTILKTATPPGTGGFNVSQQITEVTGSRVAALLSNVSAFTERSALATEAMLSLLSGGAPLIQPPLLPAGQSSTTGGNGIGTLQINLGGITVRVDGGVSDPDAIGQRIAETAIAQIDRQLAERQAWASRALGADPSTQLLQ